MSTDTGLEQHAARLRAELARSLIDSGELSDPSWPAAFESVPRHVFVPTFYDNNGRPVSGDDPDTRGEWLATVYEDRILVTRRTNGAATSSSTLPSLMAEMLEALQVTDDTTVLEIDTGTGYNAALLTHRLGEANVTTVDVADDLTGRARARLGRAGYRPRVITGDGALGHPEAAPYGRVLVTCGITSVPLPWLDQLADDGIVLAPLGLGMVRIRRTGHRAAEDRFIGTAAFMPLRRGDETGVPKGDLAGLDDAPGRPSAMPATALVDNAFRFLASIVEPGLVRQYRLDGNRTPAGTRVWAADGSIAALAPDSTVTEAGPRRLWSSLEDANATFRDHGDPTLDRYGVTIESTIQHAWLDTPDGPRDKT